MNDELYDIFINMYILYLFVFSFFAEFWRHCVWGAECLNIRFPLPTLLHAEYSVN